MVVVVVVVPKDARGLEVLNGPNWKPEPNGLAVVTVLVSSGFSDVACVVALLISHSDGVRLGKVQDHDDEGWSCWRG